jgi:predicted glycosyl hydrolase (DUF1957 family)
MRSRNIKKIILLVSACIFCAILLFLFFVVYHASPHPKLSGALIYYGYSDGHQIGNNICIESGSDTYKAIQAWLNKKRAWKLDINSYAPEQVITCKGISINFTGSRIVLNIHDQKWWNWSQYSCKSDEELITIFKQIQKKVMCTIVDSFPAAGAASGGVSQAGP